MKANMGSTDKTIRLTLAIVVAMLYYFNAITGITALILGGIAMIFALTSFISFCPVYTILGISTCKTKR